MSAPPAVERQHRSPGLGTRIFVGMVVGTALGVALGERMTVLQPLGDLFIRLLLLAAVPLVFFNLLAGLTALDDARAFGRLASKALGYFVATDVAALSLGIAAMYVLRPGVGMQLSEPVVDAVGSVPSLADVLLDMVPSNVFQAFAEGNVVQLVVVATLLGVSALMMPPEPRERIRGAFSDLATLFRKLVDVILWVAPVGIGALMAVTVGRYGGQLLGPMTLFLVGVWGAQLVWLGVYMVFLTAFTDRAPLGFLRETGALWATTAATTSSLASLSVGLETAEKIGMPRSVYSFTLPLGVQLNKDGTSIMLGAVLIFTAQAAGVDFSVAAHVTILLIGLLLSEGSGGIPGGGLVIALIYVQAFSLPIEVAAIVGGIYRLVDMGNTTINIMGDMVGTAIIERSEGRRVAGVAGPGGAA